MLTPEFIQKTVEDYFKLPEGSIQIKTRKRDIVQVRQLAMYFSKAFIPKMSLAYIGAVLGRKDHATVLHAIKTVKNLKDSDKVYRLDFYTLKEYFEKADSGSGSKDKDDYLNLMSKSKHELISIIITHQNTINSLRNALANLSD